MGKTSKSSSSKYKRSKYSSQGRMKKSKKARRSKLKKRQSRHDSVSSLEDDSRSSRSVSSFSSEDSYRGRSRPRVKKDVSRSKRRHYSSSSSSEDSARARKRKRSKGNNDSKERKRSGDKKKSMSKKARRDASSRSWSCSTCQRSSSFSGDTRGNDKRKPEDYKGGGRKGRPRSCSSCSGHDGINEHWSEEKVTDMYNSKRLRSVITVIHKSNEEGEQNRDEQKEEMVYDNDDYPSCRSNDSNDGGNRRETAHPSHVKSGIGEPIEDDNGEDQTTKLSESSNMEGQSVRSDTLHGTNDALNKSQKVIPGTVECANNDDLESVLRQRALENLKKFRQGAQVNSKSVVEQKATSDSVIANTELGKIRSPTDEAGLLKGDSSYYLQKHGETPNQMSATHESKSIDNGILPNNKVAITDRQNVRMPNKPRLVTSALKQALSNVTTTPTVTPSREHSQATLVGCGNSVGVEKMVDQAAAAVVSPGGNVTTEADNASGSASDGARSSVRDTDMSKLQNEPELQEKTMSVMRGGELVQVSYKVYIPKKTPALARRQLKR